jgi:uncharacterized protein (DUF1501 family)
VLSSAVRFVATAGAATGLAQLGADAAGAAAADGTLVVVFLRGGMDGLSVVVPAEDPQLLAARPDLAVRGGSLLALDRGFGLHPALAPLHGFWKSGQMAAVHAVSTPDISRSHFQAQDCLERGGAGSGTTSGWLDRVLEPMAAGTQFRAVAQGSGLPRSLAGSQPSLSMEKLERLKISSWEGVRDQVLQTLEAIHHGVGSQEAEVMKAIEASKRAQAIVGDENGDKLPGYDDDGFSQGVGEVARLIKSNLGVRVAAVDLDGFDTHHGQGNAEGGRLHDMLDRVGKALAAFATDLGDRWARTTVVLMTEFGRRIEQNGSGGTDHGHGSVVLLLGGGLVGGKVHGNWQGLAPEVRDQGDVPGLNDFRNVLGDLVVGRLGLSPAQVAKVFPDHKYESLGLMR